MQSLTSAGGSTSHEVLCGELPKLSDKVMARRMRLSGHCFRLPELAAGQLIARDLVHGQKRRGRPRASFVDVLKRGAGAGNSQELESCLRARRDWKSICAWSWLSKIPWCSSSMCQPESRTSVVRNNDAAIVIYYQKIRPHPQAINSFWCHCPSDVNTGLISLKL